MNGDDRKQETIKKEEETSNYVGTLLMSCVMARGGSGRRVVKVWSH